MKNPYYAEYQLTLLKLIDESQDALRWAADPDFDSEERDEKLKRALGKTNEALRLLAQHVFSGINR